MSGFLINSYFNTCLKLLYANDKDKKVLDLSKKLEEKRNKDQQEKILQELQQHEPQTVERDTADQLAQKREQKFLEEVEKESGVWMHRFSDVRKDDQGYFILKSDNPAGKKMRPGDQLADLAINMTPYWVISSIVNDRINLKPTKQNPLHSGVGAGGAKITKHDIDVYTGDYERKRVEQINKALETGNIDVDKVKYILLGTVPVNFGPNGAQGGWYNAEDSYSNRGGRQGLSPKEIMMRDAQTLKDHGLPVPVKALDGTMQPYDWTRWVEGNGTEVNYTPKNIDKYVDFVRNMTQKGKWRYDDQDIEKMYRKYDPNKLDQYFEKALSDISDLSPEEWNEKYPYYEQNIKNIMEIYERSKQDLEKAQNKTQEFLTDEETDDLESIMKNVFSKERRVSNRNILLLIEMCKENPEYIKYLYDIMRLGGSPDYLANEHVIKFFDLIDDTTGLKLAATHLKDSDNIRYALSYLFEQGEPEFAVQQAVKFIDDFQILDAILDKMRKRYEESPQRRETIGRNQELLDFVKYHKIVDKLLALLNTNPKDSRQMYYGKDVAHTILRSFGPNMMWQPGDEELVNKLKEFIV